MNDIYILNYITLYKTNTKHPCRIHSGQIQHGTHWLLFCSFSKMDHLNSCCYCCCSYLNLFFWFTIDQIIRFPFFFNLSLPGIAHKDINCSHSKYIFIHIYQIFSDIINISISLTVSLNLINIQQYDIS